ncbi:MAG TPA: HPr(Ser) kinase/phosphatase [Burkholderiales bacterium]|nr:HPr(Ser) kinase/phosphatase [Burkholderiales bacterium]
MPKVSAAQLFQDNCDRLVLSWIAGDSNRSLSSDDINRSSKGVVGHLNFIHPNWLQVLDGAEIQYLSKLDPPSLQRALQSLSANLPFCFIIAGNAAVPPALQTLAEEQQIPLIRSAQSSLQLMNVLRVYLSKVLAESINLHGVFLDVLGMGVLLTGESGVGKSELALELISRGHGLVADDSVEFYLIAPETLEGRCPPLLKDYLEVRGLGVLNIRTIFGETAVRPKMNLKLIAHLERPKGSQIPGLERLPLGASFDNVLGVKIRKVTIPVAEGRNLAVLVEAAVRNYILQLRGIDSTKEFIQRHDQMMDKPEGKQ